MSGTILYWESASRFQGNPVKMRATIISIATQNTAERKAQAIRSPQLSFEISFSITDQCSPGTSLLLAATKRSEGGTPDTVRQSQTHVAGNRDKKAASTIHPRIGKP